MIKKKLICEKIKKIDKTLPKLAKDEGRVSN